MEHGEAVSEYGETLVEIADRLYAARRSFLQANFDSYVTDSYYYIPDDGYYCWPAQSDGVFSGFTDLTAAEESIVEELTASGFELLGVGASRIVCGFPAAFADDIVVKFGRCGMGDAYGAGQINNLREFAITNATTNVPVIPCRYCDPQGRYAIYPKAQPVSEGDVAPTTVRELKSLADEEVPDLRDGELDDIDNLGRWNDRICILDYCAFDDFSYPLGVPDHVDAEAVIRRVDTLRRRGEKQDIKAAGTLVAPDPEISRSTSDSATDE